jgi:hypothetical protein
MTEYRYKLKKTGYGSERYGVCEVCKKQAKEIYMQTEEKKFMIGKAIHWAHQGSLFGHKKCLIKKRK